MRSFWGLGAGGLIWLAVGHDDSRTDQQLVAAINGGEDSAFDEIYLRHRDWVGSLALRFTGDHEDALDVTQEVFIYLAGKFPGFALSSRMTTFLYPVVKNLSIGLMRRKKRMIHDEMLLSEAAAKAPAESDASRAELAGVMAELPEAQRETLLMRFVDGFTLEEIAEALKIPVGTVKSRLHLALAAMRENPRVRKYFEK